VRAVAKAKAEKKKEEQEDEERAAAARRRRAEIQATVVWHKAPVDSRAHHAQYGESDDWGFPPSPATQAAELARTHRRMAEWRLGRVVDEVARAREDWLGRGLCAAERDALEAEVKEGMR
jgi:hypothetical protein